MSSLKQLYVFGFSFIFLMAFLAYSYFTAGVDKYEAEKYKKWAEQYASDAGYMAVYKSAMEDSVISRAEAKDLDIAQSKAGEKK
ncbi:hypothetical protein THMIRHAS_17100 [Thiosulfatimonas sediminis]|uniref:Uncharacterized protein n=1 Tax=Thiosulfatimonas sediminis TaxID=2675054 RepID=A0A6F8PWC5_9GAMM|nr:hypothetical protein [Thiosulfatimonas sediminis]BBP46337.1 hypothetical protein THMIRHAS_17100 [Thiosulfatimonas sediminis]